MGPSVPWAPRVCRVRRVPSINHFRLGHWAISLDLLALIGLLEFLGPLGFLRFRGFLEVLGFLQYLGALWAPLGP